jgi:RNA polymerase sigma-70 factor (ECF subfamily)
MTGSREASEDLVQDVFAVAYEKGAAFLVHEKPAAFLYTTARNLTLTYIKRQRAGLYMELDENIPSDDTGGDLLAQVLREQDRRVDETAYVRPVLESLPDKQRTLYARRYGEHQSIGEIASAENVSETAVRMRLVRLRREIIDTVKNLKLDEY